MYNQTNYYMKKILLLLCAGSLLFSNALYSQGGSFDASFGTNGKVITTVGSNLNDMVLQPDGKIVAIGDIAPAGTNDQFVVARYMPNGSLDTSFGTNGSLKTLYGAKCGAWSVVLQADGKIVVAGYTSVATNNSGHRDAMIVRYNTDGTPDATFGVQGIKILPFTDSGKATTVDIQSDGKIIVGGQLGGKFLVARLLENGDLDVSFNTVGYTTYSKFNGYYEVGAIKVLNDGKVLVAGRGDSIFVVVKYNQDGSSDTSFGNEGFVDPAGITATPAIIYNMLTLSNGDFIVAGGAMYSGKYMGVMVKFNSIGALVTTFANNGVLITDVSAGTSTQAIDVVTFNDKIYAGYSSGPTTNYDFRLSAYSMDGALDTTFGDQGSIQFYFGSATVHDYLHSVVMQPDGKILMGGRSATGGFSLARIASGVLGTHQFSAGANTFGVYPNPVTAQSKLITNLSSGGRYALGVYDIQGKLIADLGETDFTAGATETIIALPVLSQGVYFLTISASGKEVKSLKLVY